MRLGPGVKTSRDFPVPETMRAWVLGDPGQLLLVDKTVPVPGRAEVLVRIDAVAICATAIEHDDGEAFGGRIDCGGETRGPSTHDHDIVETVGIDRSQ